MVGVRTSVVFCDEIRQEINGKFLLIGVYVGEMIVLELPARFFLATFIQFHGLAAGVHSIVSRVVVNSGGQESQLGKIEVNLDVTHPELPAAIAPGGLFVAFESLLDSENSIDVLLSIDGGEEFVADSLKMKGPSQQMVSAVTGS